MNELQAMVLIDSISNSACKLIVIFLAARRPMDVGTLQEWSDMKRETIYESLSELESFAMVEQETVAHGRVIWTPTDRLLKKLGMGVE